MEETLSDTLVIGWCDVAAAGCRAILGSREKWNKYDLEVKSLDIGSLQEQIFCDEEKVPIVIKKECDNEKVSMIAISSQLSIGGTAHLIDEIVNNITASSAKGIVVVAALHIKIKSITETDVVQFNFNCKQADGIPTLPENIPTKDPLLNMLIQMAQVERIPLRCFLTQGYKVASGKPNSIDGSLQSIKNLQRILNSLYGINFSEEKTKLLEYREKEAESKSVNAMFL